jgi:hypothetical protein
MDSGAFERQLREEGFGYVYVWQDAAHAFYPDHTHPVETAHVVLEGEMTLTCAGSTRTPGRTAPASARRPFRPEPSTRPGWGRPAAGT